MSSVRAIAKRAGVSITTVSRALNDDPAVNPKTRELVLRVANSFGYAASVGRRVTTQIGLAYTQDITLTHPFDAAVLEGILRGTDEARFDLVILHLQRDKRPDETFTQFFRRKGVRGVLLRTVAESRHLCERIAAEGFPHVVISERFDAPGMNCIDCDSKPDSYRAVEYLIALGHERIGFAMHNTPDRDHLDRLDGYRAALTAHGLPLDDGLIFRHPFNLAGGATVLNMVVSLRQPPTALYFADPLMAVGALQKAQALGVRIPDQLSIVGFDDADLRYSVYPTLTAVCQPASQLGFEATLWLTRRLMGDGQGSLQRTISTFFEINASTAPPPNQVALAGAGTARGNGNGHPLSGSPSEDAS